MLKFIKHNLETIDGVDIYPIISLTIFFLRPFISLISIIVAGVFPFFAWEINEIRMKIYNRKNGAGKIKG